MNTSNQPQKCCCAEKKTLVETIPEKKVKTHPVLSTLLSVLIAFFPKCPLCWAAYLSMFGSVSIAKLPYMGWLLPVLFGFLGIHLFFLYRKAARAGYAPFLLSLAGAVALLVCRMFFTTEKWLLMSGMILIISGSLLNSLSRSRPLFSITKNSQFQ
ncbi:hypothetical protein [Taibaiella soli]|uniref:MerC domain-containing protein n=1 Tax=Taibaiella soli TaxID=1649169 RepID=A0A2W2BJT4_9BACT|nr:hypothetical protein [Taibaiella soli]PZF73706.1 hypothetical protein DN068_06840 [Taibaiella soli]